MWSGEGRAKVRRGSKDFRVIFIPRSVLSDRKLVSILYLHKFSSNLKYLFIYIYLFIERSIDRLITHQSQPYF